jgi:pimeloyl-ACP methyl ester carboxylesterase
MRNILVKTVNEDQTDSSHHIIAPTLILNGENDTQTPVEMAQRLHKYIRNSQLILLPGKDHFPFLGEGAHLCASYIRRFLMSEDGGASSVNAGH